MNSLQTFGAGVGLLLSAVLLGGCSSDGEFTTAKVDGQVLYQGQGVAGAVIVFRPIEDSAATLSGKAANGNADESGRFTLSTYEMGDGAIVGKHRVSVSAEDPMKPLPGRVPDDLIIEVKRGSNNLTIELVP
jgi:hypothetical protein